MLKKEKECLNQECYSEEAEEEINKDTALFIVLMALGTYREMPEDYWEKEGIGWK